jgi:DNA uptake protein ComE-like DNA-binding protein
MQALRFRLTCAAFLAVAALALVAPFPAAAETQSKSKAAKVELNSATEKELEDLPGVGPATAEKIIAGRPYASVADLEKAGVSAKTIAEIKPLVTVKKPKASTSSTAKAEPTTKEPKAADSSASGKSASSKSTASKTTASKTTASKVDVNSATEKELEDLPGVGPATAAKIIAGRPYATVADLEKAGVTAKTLEEIKPLVTARKVKATSSASTHAAPATKSTSTTRSTTASKPAETTTAPKATATTRSADEQEEVEARTPPRAGLVWVNTESKVFHVEGDRWYGKTKKGEWMTEAEALQAGYRPVKEPEPKAKP